MRSLSATEKLIPSPWLPSRKVVSYISTSGFIVSRKDGKGIFTPKTTRWQTAKRRNSPFASASRSALQSPYAFKGLFCRGERHRGLPCRGRGQCRLGRYGDRH